MTPPLGHHPREGWPAPEWGDVMALIVVAGGCQQCVDGVAQKCH